MNSFNILAAIIKCAQVAPENVTVNPGDDENLAYIFAYHNGARYQVVFTDDGYPLATYFETYQETAQN